MNGPGRVLKILVCHQLVHGVFLVGSYRGISVEIVAIVSQRDISHPESIKVSKDSWAVACLVQSLNTN